MEIIKIVNVEKCGIESLAFLPNNTLLVGATIGINNLPYYSFIQFKLNDENNDLIEISRKNHVHGWTIYDLKYVVINGQYKIASSGSMDCKIKIWS
jgi:WD40 repeat protein